MSNLILHKRSVVVNDGIPKLPTPDQLEYGELAINFADGHETLTIKNSADEIAEFKSKEYFENIIIENELVTAEALNNLNERITYFEDFENVIDENELVTATALNERITSVEEVIDENELVTATALNDLNEKIIYLLQEITYDELVALRNKAQLSPGHFYRITDYVTTTLATDTLSHGKPFDIIVLATDVDVLDENAKAIQHDGDTYFKNCKLSAWKLKYSLDNDTTRFEWADKTNGKGVIYYMADEWGNECPYDFKNITFRHPNNSADTAYYFTFTNRTTSAVSATDKSITYGYCYGNVIKSYVEYNRMKLNKIIFITNPTTFCNSNSFGNDCYKNSFGDNCKNNFFGNYCQNNSFGNYCQHNSFGHSCLVNSFGNYCSANSFGNNCSSNSFGNNCSNNSFGNNCRINSFGNNCSSNSFGNNCSSNSFGTSASTSGTLKTYCYYNHFDDGCSFNVIWNADTASSSYKLQNVNITRGVSGTSSAYNMINIDTINAAYEIKVSKNSSGAIKIYCEADLIQ